MLESHFRNVTLLKQSSTAEIFPRILLPFSAKFFHKAHLNNKLEKVFICLVSQTLLLQQGNCRSLIGEVLINCFQNTGKIS